MFPSASLSIAISPKRGNIKKGEPPRKREARPARRNSEGRNDKMEEIKITRTTAPKEKTPSDKLGFGKVFSDHMFLMNYDEGQG